jgi:hypothetical protein
MATQAEKDLYYCLDTLSIFALRNGSVESKVVLTDAKAKVDAILATTKSNMEFAQYLKGKADANAADPYLFFTYNNCALWALRHGVVEEADALGKSMDYYTGAGAGTSVGLHDYLRTFIPDLPPVGITIGLVTITGVIVP